MRLAVREAKNDLAVAELNLERTEIKAPFDGIVLVRYIDVGGTNRLRSWSGFGNHLTPQGILDELKARFGGDAEAADATDTAGETADAEGADAVDAPAEVEGFVDYQERIPGANGQPHAVLEGAGHFLGEDRPTEFAELALALANSTD